MTCFHPLLAERVNPRSARYDPKKKIKIYKESEIDITLPQRESGAVSDFFYIPCGRCIGCRIDKARDWAVRLMCEAETSSSAWFLTITYDQEHFDSLSLSKKDLQEFIQNLRNKVRFYNPYVKLRYFACGEYGDKSGRKHYHMILFNMPDLDLKPVSVSKGNILYSSDIINNVWKKGFVVFGKVTVESASYVARYTLKKQGLKDYEDLGIQSPFILMSTRPGIGFDYLQARKYQLVNDWKIQCGHGYSHIPRYFMRILEDDPEFTDVIKSHKEDLKELSFDKQFNKQFINDRRYSKLLSDEEINLLKEQENVSRDSF